MISTTLSCVSLPPRPKLLSLLFIAQCESELNNVWSTMFGVPYLEYHVWTTMFGVPCLEYLDCFVHTCHLH